MRGEEHVLISVLGAGLMILPVLPGTDLLGLVVIFMGVIIGSLAPDADIANAAIMHGFRNSKRLNFGLRGSTVLFLPYFGYIVRYLIYYPVSAVIWVLSLGRVKPRHRGFLHSFFGGVITTLLLLLYIGLASVWLNCFNTVFLLMFGSGFFAGYMMHLLEDSCTKCGVAWVYPFSKKRLCGEVVPWNKREYRPFVFCLLIVAVIAVIVLAGCSLPVPGGIFVMVPVAFFALWAVFFLLSGVHVA